MPSVDRDLPNQWLPQHPAILSGALGRVTLPWCDTLVNIGRCLVAMVAHHMGMGSSTTHHAGWLNVMQATRKV